MYYDPDKRDHGLPHDPLKALVVPRPIGWISTVDANGTANLAPYSFFNLLSESPAYVMFSSAWAKDSLTNIEATGEFVCNLSSEHLFEEMLASSAAYPPGASEPEHLNIQMRKSNRVAAPSVADAHATLECAYHLTLELPGSGYHAVIGRVLSVYISEDVLVDGLVSTEKVRPVSRLGYRDYAITEHTFDRLRPPDPVID